MKNRWRHLFGTLLLMGVVFLWVSANFLMSYLFNDVAYAKPFFTSYLNTSTFTIYFLVIPILQLRHGQTRGRLTSLASNEDGYIHGEASEYSAIGNESDTSTIVIDDVPPSPPLTTKETIILGVQFCILWFLANYCNNASLSLTSVASSTILSCTSSLWTLVIGVVVGVEKFSFMRVFAIFSSLLGVVLIATKAQKGASSGLQNNIYGDLIALFGALFYGMYITLLKKRVGHESRMNPLLFFGFVGLSNVLLLWPLFFIFHYIGIESFEPPSSGLIWRCLLLNAFLGTCLSELLWLLSMLMTTPLIATMGLSLTIPLALVGDLIKGAQFSFQFFLGALFVISSFAIVNIADLYVETDRKFDLMIWETAAKIKSKFRRSYQQV